MIGQSYLCWSQWNAARTRPPHLTTIVPYDGATDMYRDWMYQGGIVASGFVANWITGSIMLQHQAEGLDIYGGDRYKAIPDIFAHQFDDEWHRKRAPFWELDQVDIPVFSIGVWGKATLHLRGNVEGYNRVRGPKQLLIAHPDTLGGGAASVRAGRFPPARDPALVRPLAEGHEERRDEPRPRCGSSSTVKANTNPPTNGRPRT